MGIGSRGLSFSQHIPETNIQKDTMSLASPSSSIIIKNKQKDSQFSSSGLPCFGFYPGLSTKCPTVPFVTQVSAPNYNFLIARPRIRKIVCRAKCKIFICFFLSRHCTLKTLPNYSIVLLIYIFLSEQKFYPLCFVFGSYCRKWVGRFLQSTMLE